MSRSQAGDAMSGDWIPRVFSEDPVANAILNVAAEINGHSVEVRRINTVLSSALGPSETDDLCLVDSVLKCAEAIDGIVYGLKFSKVDGMSISESIEVVGKKMAEALEDGLPGRER